MKLLFAVSIWGLLLVALDFSINGFDLLPDFAGYILVAIAALGLSPLSSQFIIACSLSSILAICSVVGLFISNDVQVFGIVVTIVHCAMMWTLLGGIMEFAQSRQRPDLSQRAANLRIVYIGLIAASMAAGILATALGNIVALLAIPLVLALLVALVMILLLINRVRNELFGSVAERLS